MTHSVKVGDRVLCTLGESVNVGEVKYDVDGKAWQRREDYWWYRSLWLDGDVVPEGKP